MSVFGNNIYEYRDSVITEAYVGKTPLLLECEKAIQKIRESKNNSFYKDINRSKEILELNRLLEKQFGMEICCVQLYPSKILNGYTMVLGNTFDVAEELDLAQWVIADKQNGYRFKPGNNFCINVHLAQALFMDDNFTNAEIVAIILHEIGHNFADCIYDPIGFANKDGMIAYKKAILAMTLIGIIILIATGDISGWFKGLYHLRVLNNKYRNTQAKKERRKAPNILRSIINGIRGNVNDFNYFVDSVLNRLFGKTWLKAKKKAAELSGAKERARNSLARQNEVIADKFAGIYGYGPDQVSALFKFDSIPGAAEKFVQGLGKFGEEANYLYQKIVEDLCDFDCHPHNIQRAYEEIKLLENELKKESCDPKAKEAIQKQIDDIKLVINEFLKIREEFSKSEKAKRLYYAYVNGSCPDAISDEIENAIEKAFDELMDNGHR